MRIAYLASANSIHTVKLVNELAKRGHDIHLFSMYNPEKINPIDKAVKVNILPIRPPWGYYLNALYLKKALRTLTPDLVHAHYAIGYGILARLASYHPVLLSIWGYDVLVYPNRNIINKSILRKNLNAADFLAATSNALAEHVKHYFNAEKDIYITPFGVDCNIFKQNKFIKNKNEILIGTIKGLEEYYGIEYLMRAFARLIYKHPSLPLKLLIVGEGSQKNEFEKLAKHLNIRHLTTFAGRIANSNAPSYLNKLSVYVAVSLVEGFGVAVLEASACGVPVVVSSVGGLPEVAKDGVTGYLVPPKDEVATAKAIEKIILNSSLRNKLGEGGRKFVLENYEFGKCVSIMEGVYNKIVNN